MNFIAVIISWLETQGKKQCFAIYVSYYKINNNAYRYITLSPLMCDTNYKENYKMCM